MLPRQHNTAATCRVHVRPKLWLDGYGHRNVMFRSKVLVPLWQLTKLTRITLACPTRTSTLFMVIVLTILRIVKGLIVKVIAAILHVLWRPQAALVWLLSCGAVPQPQLSPKVAKEIHNPFTASSIYPACSLDYPWKREMCSYVLEQTRKIKPKIADCDFWYSLDNYAFWEHFITFSLFRTEIDVLELQSRLRSRLGNNPIS